MKAIDNFSWKRVWRVFKDDLRNILKMKYRNFPLIFFLMTVVNIYLDLSHEEVVFARGNSFYSAERSVAHFASSLNFFFIAIFFGGACGITSAVVERFKKKETAIPYLMQPASMSEKFVSALLMVTVVYSVGFGILLLLVGGVYSLLHPLFNLPEQFHVWLYSMNHFGLFVGLDESVDSISHIQFFQSNNVLALFSLYAMLGWLTSIFLVISAYSGKFTYYVHTVVVIALLPILFMAGDAINPYTYIHSDFGLIMFSLLCLLLIPFNWWISYRLFCRLQIC